MTIRLLANEISTSLNFTFVVDNISQEMNEMFSLNITDVNTTFEGSIEIQNSFNGIILDHDGMLKAA